MSRARELSVVSILVLFSQLPEAQAQNASCAQVVVKANPDCKKHTVQVDLKGCSKDVKLQGEFESCSAGTKAIPVSNGRESAVATIKAVNGAWGNVELEVVGVELKGAPSGQPAVASVAAPALAPRKVASEPKKLAPPVVKPKVELKAPAVRAVAQTENPATSASQSAPQTSVPAEAASSGSTPSAAQAPTAPSVPAAQAPGVVPPSVVTQPAEPAPVAGPPATLPAPPPAVAKEEPSISIYGFFLPQVIHSTHAMGSYGGTNASAITEAAQGSDRSRTALEAQQSRVGFNYKGSGVRGRMEVDFFDAGKSTPTTQSVPRLRIAKVEYDLAPGHVLAMGQDWDLFSPLHPHTYNFVGSQFRSGNAGFLRQQVSWLGNFGPVWEAAASVGFPTPNAASTDQDPELENQPAYQVRVAAKLGKVKVGVSGVYSRFGYAGAPLQAIDSNAGGVNLFSEAVWESFEYRLEAFHGHNLQNINMLTLGQANRINRDADEVGGYLSLKWKTKTSSIFGGYGFDQLLDESWVDTTGKGVKGLRSNQQLRLGVDREIAPKTRAYIEGLQFWSEYPGGYESGYAQLLGIQLSF